MGIFYILLLLGTIVTGAVGLSGGVSGVGPPPATAITPTLSSTQYVPLDVNGGPGKSTLQLDAIAFGTITPTGMPAPTSSATPTSVVTSTCTVDINGGEHGYTTTQGQGSQHQASSDLTVSYDPANPSQSTLDYSWQDAESATCLSYMNAIKGSVTEVYKGTCQPSGAYPPNSGLEFTFSARNVIQSVPGTCGNTSAIKSVTICAVPNPANGWKINEVVNFQNNSVSIPPFQSGWQVFVEQAPSHGNYSFSIFKPSSTCPTLISSTAPTSTPAPSVVN